MRQRPPPYNPPGSGSAHAGVARVGRSHRLTSSAGLHDSAGTTSPSSNESEDVLADVAELLAAC